MIKIILFRGGFAGDLITALHDMDCFQELTSEGRVLIDSNIHTLNEVEDMTIDDKDQYFDKHPIMSCCDPEFALKYKNETLLVKCDDQDMARYFCKRFYQYHPEMIDEIPLEDYITSFGQWSHFWAPKFKKTLDLSDIFTNENFLSKMDIVLDDKKIKLFNDWREINQKSFSSHRETYDQ